MKSFRMKLMKEMKDASIKLQQDGLSSLEIEDIEKQIEQCRWSLKALEQIISFGIGEKYATASLGDLEDIKNNSIEAFFHTFKLEGSERYIIDKTEYINLFEFFTEFVDNFTDPQQYGTSIIITGPVGSGKTHAAVALMLQIIRKHRTVKYNEEEDFGKMYSSDMSYRFVQIHDLFALIASRDFRSDIQVNKIRDSDILVVDDLGAEQGSPDWLIQQLIHRVIKFRDSCDKTTIFTSNLGPEDFCKVYGQRASSVMFGNKYKHITIKSEKSWRLIDG